MPTKEVNPSLKVALVEHDASSLRLEGSAHEKGPCLRQHREVFICPWNPRLMHPQSIPHVIPFFFLVPLNGSTRVVDFFFLFTGFLPALNNAQPSCLVYFFFPPRQKHLLRPFQRIFTLCSRNLAALSFWLFSVSTASCPSQVSLTPATNCTACFTTISSSTDSVGLSFFSSSGPTHFCRASITVYPCSGPDLAPSAE